MPQTKPTPTLYLDGPIGASQGGKLTAASVRSQLAAFADAPVVRVEINSDGGDLVEGLAIYSALRAHRSRKVGVVMGMAASMASVLLQACDERRMARGSFLMIHGAEGGAKGKPAQIEAAAATIRKLETSMLDIYAARAKLPRGKLVAMLADGDHYLSAEEAVAQGFADAVETFDAKVPYEAVAQLQRDPSPGARRVLLALGRGRPLLSDPKARAAQYLAQARRQR